MIDLSVKIGPLSLSNPVLTASGTFGYAEEFKDFIDLNELGGIVTKTVTLDHRPGNPPPRIVEYSNGMLNSIGLPNDGIERFISEKMPFLQQLKTTVIINVAGKTEQEFVEVVERLNDVSGIAAYELNCSCPNVKQGGLSFSSDPTIAERLTRQVKKVARRPIIVKLTPNVTHIHQIGLAVERAGADAISAVNTFLGMGVDIRTRRPKLNRAVGGYSGPAIKPMALAKVYELVRHVNIPVIAIGGIRDADDALEFLITGARAVQIGSANFTDPTITLNVKQGLIDYCRTENINSITHIIGSLEDRT